MDKLNYTLKGDELQEVKQKILKIKWKVKNTLEEAGVIRRKRVLQDYAILVQALILHIIKGFSFQRLADTMTVKYGVAMSDTAWKKQILKAAPFFYEAAMDCLNSQKPQTKGKKILGHSSVYAVDATCVPWEGTKGTALKVHTVYSLSGYPRFESVIAGIHTGESVRLHNIRSHGLYLGDRAYGRTPQMAYLLGEHADFIFRFSPYQVKMYKDRECKEKMEFDSALPEKGRTASFDCFFKGKKCVCRVRIVVASIPQEKVEQAVKRARKNSQKKCENMAQNTLLFAEWLFLATSLPEDISSEEIISTFRDRWQIELHFKRLKTLLCFHKLRRSSLAYARCLVYIWLGFAALVYALFPALLSCIPFDISTFNSFSLIADLLA